MTERRAGETTHTQTLLPGHVAPGEHLLAGATSHAAPPAQRNPRFRLRDEGPPMNHAPTVTRAPSAHERVAPALSSER